MRKSAVASILFLISLVAHAQSQTFATKKPVICSDPRTIIENLSNKFSEQPFWSGAGSDTKYILFSNPETGTWTMVEYNNEVACVIGAGKRARQIFLGPGT